MDLQENGYTSGHTVFHAMPLLGSKNLRYGVNFHIGFGAPEGLESLNDIGIEEFAVQIGSGVFNRVEAMKKRTSAARWNTGWMCLAGDGSHVSSVCWLTTPPCATAN